MTLALKISIVFWSLLLASVARAEVILDITLADGAQISITEEQIFALDQSMLATSTAWTDGVPRFEGPLVRDVLETFAGVQSKSHGGNGYTLRFTAANDYSTQIPLAVFYDYDALLATSMNGQRLTLRDKGPLWVVYPAADYPELGELVHSSRWIWQLIEIELP